MQGLFNSRDPRA